MKKLLFILAAGVLVISCNKLAENEYEITGEISESLNGSHMVLEKPGGFAGVTPIDTVKIVDGKFVFKGTATDATLHYVSVLDMQNTRLDIILEPGALHLKVDKDSIFKSQRSGTPNNDILQSYRNEIIKVDKKSQAYIKKNKPAFIAAMQKNDTVTTNKLNKELQKLGEEKRKLQTDFLEKNPNALISIFIIREMAGGKTADEVMAMYNKLGSGVKKSAEGKQLFEQIQKYKEQQNQVNEAEENPAKPVATVEIGKPAPDFTAPTPDGKMVSLKQSLGKVTIIDFWASWCGPCRRENPNVVALYNEMHPKGLNIIGVSLDKEGEADKWKQAIAADKLTWTHVSNLKQWADPIAQQYGVTAIPATFILDAKGNVVARDLRGAELRAKVTELLKG